MNYLPKANVHYQTLEYTALLFSANRWLAGKGVSRRRNFWLLFLWFFCFFFAIFTFGHCMPFQSKAVRFLNNMGHYGHSQIARLSAHLRNKYHEDAYWNGKHGITPNLIRAYQNYRACERLFLP